METVSDIKKNTDHPPYYGGKDNPYEAIKVLKAWGLDKDAYLWNTVKYLSRAGHKDGNSLLQDLTKARWYLDYKIQLLTEQQKVAEEVVDTINKIMPSARQKIWVDGVGFTDKYTNDMVYRPDVHTPQIETAVVPECADEVKF